MGRKLKPPLHAAALPARLFSIDFLWFSFGSSLSLGAAGDGSVHHPRFARRQFREAYSEMKYVPLDLRPKKTRAIRRRLTDEQVCV